jgi:malonate transporter
VTLLPSTENVRSAACPISASSYVLARLLGGDAPLLATLITITTLAAALTMPLVLGLLT